MWRFKRILSKNNIESKLWISSERCKRKLIPTKISNSIGKNGKFFKDRIR
jgi:hypothetical protein